MLFVPRLTSACSLIVIGLPAFMNLCFTYTCVYTCFLIIPLKHFTMDVLISQNQHAAHLFITLVFLNLLRPNSQMINNIFLTTCKSLHYLFTTDLKCAYFDMSLQINKYICLRFAQLPKAYVLLCKVDVSLLSETATIKKKHIHTTINNTFSHCQVITYTIIQ